MVWGHCTISTVILCAKPVQDKVSAEGYISGGNEEYDEVDRSSSRKMPMSENVPLHDATSSTSVDPSHSTNGNICMQYTPMWHILRLVLVCRCLLYSLLYEHADHDVESITRRCLLEIDLVYEN